MAEEKELTGVYVRVEADSGRFVTKDITDLSDSEIGRFIEGAPPADLARWVRFLTHWIRDNVQKAP